MTPRVPFPSIRDLATQRAHGEGDDIIAELRARYMRYADRLQPYVTHAPDRVPNRDAGDAQNAGLRGVPVSIKDLFGINGWPTYAGSPQRLPERFEESGPFVLALKRLGAELIGKTHTVEFAFGGLGLNPHWPVPRNPWDRATHRVPGGSSAGAGVSLYCDARLAVGTDTAGSVRIPASMTGVVGLKTSYGRWPLGGVVPLSPSLDSIGLLADSVADVRYAFTVIDRTLKVSATDTAHDTPPLRGLRVGIGDALFWEGCDVGITETVRVALSELEKGGARSVRCELPEAHPALELFKLGHLAAPELLEFLSSELPSWLPTLDANVAARMRDADTVTAREYLRRRRVLGELARSAHKRLASIDVLVTPTVAATPPRVADLAEPNAYRHANMRALRNTAVVNLLRLCAVTVPVGLDDSGMPVGLQLVARHGDDRRLVAVAETIENHLGTATERLGVPPALLSPA